jgi:L-threonylcarbamoyladenylate synthase
MNVVVSTPDAIVTAAQALEAGRLVAFPTETVYGLGADAENPAAVADIYKAKGRPSDHPVIVHVAPGADIRYWAKDIPHEADQLIAAFWPGPLTLILKRADHIPDAVSGGQDTVGIRCPSHPVAQQLLLAFKNGKGGVAAPSANKFGHVSPTLAQHVTEEFAQEILPGGLIAAVLDGGQSEVGIESTIVDLSRWRHMARYCCARGRSVLPN